MKNGKPSILFAYITPFHPERGGIGRVTHRLTCELQKRGYEIFYLIYPSAITIRHEYEYPAPLEYLPSSNCESEENLRFYHDFIKKHDIDIIINQSGAFGDSHLWLNTGNHKVKVISCVHQNPLISYHHLWEELYPLRNSSFKEKLKRIVRCLLYPKIKHDFLKTRINHYEWLMPQTDKLCLLSSRFLPEFRKLVCSNYDNKIIAISNPNSYDMPQLIPDGYIEKKKKIAVFVGLTDHFSPKKPDFAVRIWSMIHASIPDWKLIFIGGGKRVPQLQAMMVELGARNIEFHGFQKPDQYYHEASILCMTSLYEGWGMVITEAMQHACVPILFDSFASARDIVDNGESGILIPPFDLAEYAKQLKAIAIDQERREKLALNAYLSVQRFDVRHIVDQWEGCFAGLAEQGN